MVAPTAIEFLTSANLGSQYRNDMFVGDFNKGRIYNFNLNSQRNALVLSGVLSDRIAHTDTETQSVIFGEGFGGISDLKMGADGYLYALSIGHGAIYRILPKAPATATLSGVQLDGQDNSEPLIPLGEEISIPPDNEDDTNNNLNDDGPCKKLVDRIEQVEEQKDRGGLDAEQAEELVKE